MPIRGSPNGAVYLRPQAGRDRPESVVAINRNAWSRSIVTAGRDRPVRAVDSLSASSHLLSPIQAASQSPRHAAQLRRLDSEIYHASGCRWRLPTDGNKVKLSEVDSHIRAASIETRARIKAGLAELRLVD